MRNPIQAYLEQLADEHPDSGGEVATYIPELADADPDAFALCVATIDGYVYEVGQSDRQFSIQSISKPFTYALALADKGHEVVTEKIDVEPSGEAFNEISLASDTGRPRNPMINAGAITAASLVDGADGGERFERVLAFYSAFAGHDLGVDEAVFGSELGTAHRNRAIAHMLREFDILTGDPEEVLAQYIRQCSVEVTARDLALMAATLANGGVQPLTGERVLQPTTVEHVLSVMMSCGMYDAAGDWITNVGLPAKSGVSGGILAVLPGQVGVAVYSPRLDDHGNSARGVAVCERFATSAELHLMHVSRSSRTAVRDRYTLTQCPSRRRRVAQEQEVLDKVSDSCTIYELHGDLLFSGVETVVRTVVEDSPKIALLDVRGIDDIAQVARHTLLALQERLREAGAEGALLDPDGLLPDPHADTELASRIFTDRESALRWCEDELLRSEGITPLSDHDAREHPLLKDLPPQIRELLRERFALTSFAAGDVVLEAGSGFAGVHIIEEGEAEARMIRPDGQRMVLATMGPGTSFGELALGTGDVQETEIVAVTDLRLLILAASDLEELGDTDPEVGLQIWKAMTRDAYRVAERALTEGARRLPTSA